MEPVVSVIIPVHNCERYLGRALESILNQSFRDFELIVIDDSSTDQSTSVVESYKDSRIRFYKNTENLGIAKTLNIGIQLSKGSLIARMDGDDIAHRDRLKLQVAFLNKNDQIGVCGSWVTQIDETGRVLGQIQYPTYNSYIKAAIPFYIPMVHPSTMYRKGVIQKYAVAYRPDIKAEDHAFWLDLMPSVEFANLPETLLQYRQHSSQYSSQSRSKWFQTKDQLLRLGTLIHHFLDIEPSEVNIATWSRIVNQESVSFEDLDAIEAWLMQVSESSKHSRYLEPSVIDEMIGIKWMQLCSKIGSKNLKVFRKYYFSPLAPLLRSRRVKLNFLVQCIKSPV